MPIRIAEAPEPLSEASFEPDGSPILVESDASRLLVQELTRYCRQEINGRSFLISGHRGSGKTTLVSSAFLNVWKASENTPARMRPLLVQLHGPSLFPDPRLLGTGRPSVPGAQPPAGQNGAQAPEAGAPSGAAAPAGNGAGGQPPGQPTGEPGPGGSAAPATGSGAGGGAGATREASESETQVALKQITLCLHRALAREVARSYRERALDTTTPGEPRRRELLEIAAQLEMELYECLGPARLREVWDRGGFLERGVLFPAAAPALSLLAGEADRPDQGMRELIAVAGVCEAYCRISGTFTLQQKRADSAKEQLLASLSTDTTGKDLFGPVLSLLSGGLVGTGLVAANATGLAATAGGIAAALGAASVFKYSSTRSRDRSVSREYSFLFDFTVSTLDRALPMLLERVLGAGLAPVFVVDELDKVENLSDRILGMVHHLKKFVAERAFFCFLTDRSYFEDMTARGAEKAYPVEYTYFSHPLFVVFGHEDMHAYVRRLLEPPKVPVAEPAADAAAQVEAIRQASPANEDLADYDVLPFVLLHRAQMHPLDLQRTLSSFRDKDGFVRLAPGRVRTERVYRLEVAMQLAVEMVLRRDELRDRMQRQPDFRRLAHDALYYPTRRWQKGRELDLTDDARDDFVDYLEGRTGLKRRAEAQMNGAGEPEAGPLVSPEDVDLLFRQVRILGVLLCNRVRFANMFERHWEGYGTPDEAARVKATLRNMELPSLAPFLLRRVRGAGRHRYRWCHAPSGTAYRDDAPPGAALPAAAERGAEPEWREAVGFVRRFATWIEEL